MTSGRGGFSSNNLKNFLALGVSSTAALGGRNFLRPFFFWAGFPASKGDLGVAAAAKWTMEVLDTNDRYGGMKVANCRLSVGKVEISNAPVGRAIRDA